MMQAKKRNIREKLESLIGNVYLYRSRQVRVKGFSLGDDEVRIHNGGNTIMFPVGKLDEELDNFMPMDEPTSEELVSERNSVEKQAIAIFKQDAGQMNKLEDVLMDNIEKLQDDAKYLDQAKAINDQVKTLMDMTKTKLKMHQEIRKSKKMSD